MHARANDDITVVVVNHEYGEYLPGALRSLHEQNGGSPLVVVVDDGSSGCDTLAVLQDLEQRGDVPLVRQANRGVSLARNAGLATVRTPYVLFLDADDELPPGALARMRRPLDEDPTLAFAYGDHEWFGQMQGVFALPAYDPLRLLDRHLIGATALARTHAVLAVGGFDPAFAAYEDWELWLALAGAGYRGVHVDAVTLRYRRKAGSKFEADRAAYRKARRALRRKHAALYARRAQLAHGSDLSTVQRVVYRWFWGPRPVPAGLERRVHGLLFRPGRPEAP